MNNNDFKFESTFIFCGKQYKVNDVYWFHWLAGNGGYTWHNAKITHIDVDNKKITLDYSSQYNAQTETVRIYDIVKISEIK